MLGIPLCSVVRLLHLSRFHSTGTVRVSPRRRMESGARGSVHSLAASQVNKTKNTSRCRDATSRFHDLCSACVYPPSLKKTPLPSTFFSYPLTETVGKPEEWRSPEHHSQPHLHHPQGQSRSWIRVLSAGSSPRRQLQPRIRAP